MAAGKGDVFLGLILPHGLLELTAVYLASATGLRLGWTVIDPGQRPRGAALAEEGRAAMSIAMSIALGLVGVAAETAFLTYVIVFGRRAVKEGDTGDALLRPATAPTSG